LQAGESACRISGNEKSPMIHEQYEHEFESNLARTLEEICTKACTMTGVQHSGFVRFDNEEVGYVVAQYPTITELHGQRIQLKGVPAEEELLQSDEPLVIEDVADSDELGEVRELLVRFDIRSICIVKVRVHGRVIGSFSFDSIGERRQFTERDIALCKSFAELASSKIEKTTQDEWLKTFHRATMAINVEIEAAPLLKAIIKQAEILFRAQTVGLYLLGSDAGGNPILQLVASSTEELTGRTLKQGEGMAWQLLMSTEPYLETSDYDHYPHRAGFREGTFGAVLEVPLLTQQDRIGVLYRSDTRERHYNKSDADGLQLYADYAVSAIEHCNLIAKMRGLSAASAEMSGSSDSAGLSTKLEDIVRNATIILNAEMCGVFFREEDSNTLILKASFGHAHDCDNVGRRFEIKDAPKSGLTGALAARFIARQAKHLAENTAVRDETPVSLCGDELLSDPAVNGEGKDATPGGTCHSLIAAPLIQKRYGMEKVSGMLRVSNKKGPEGKPDNQTCFNNDDKTMLRVLTEIAVVSLESANLADERLELSKALATRKYEYLKLLSRGQEREEHLTEIALYDIKCGIFIHNQDDLVQKLAAQINEFEKTVNENWPSDNSQAVIANMAAKIAAASRELEQFYEDASRDLQKERVKLQVLERMLRKQVLRKDGVKKCVSADYRAEAMVEVDRALMGYVFTVFCDNAVDAMDGVRRKKLLNIHICNEPGECLIRFSDTGTGMNPEVWSEIVERMRPRLDTWKTRKGLRSALLAVNAFGGSIKMTSTNQGTTFEIRLPLVQDTPDVSP
jgi:signal transduction histidine kinase/transcriptional regulator with GAF, ATPase, and Fis domain